MSFLKTSHLVILACFGFSFIAGCAGSMGFNDGGSQPVNEEEALAYRRAMQRCHKTGGTRVVKIEGNLRCF